MFHQILCGLMKQISRKHSCQPLKFFLIGLLYPFQISSAQLPINDSLFWAMKWGICSFLKDNGFEKLDFQIFESPMNEGSSLSRF
jgi:hypothetical protein